MNRLKNKTILVLTLSFLFLFFLQFSVLCIGADFVEISPKNLISKMEKATDPSGALSKAYNKVTTGELIMPVQKIKMNVNLIFKSPDMLYVKSVFSDGQYVIQAYNGKVAWKFASGTTNSVIMTGRERDYFIFNAMLEAPGEKVWENLFSKFELSDFYSKVGEYECYVLTCTPRSEYNIKNPLVLYIDNKDFLLRRMDMDICSDGTLINEQIYVEKYENIHGVNVAVKTKTDIMGAEIEYFVNSFNLNNNNIDNSVFEILK